MEEGIEAEEGNLYKQTDELADNVTDKLKNMNGNIDTSVNIEQGSNNLFDYNKMANAFLSALNKCKLSFDEDGFAKIVRNELYGVI